MKLPYSTALVALGMLASYAAYAASPAVTDAVKARQASLKEIGGAFKNINDELKSGSPDMNSVKPLARDIAARTALLPKYFPKGSGPESGLKTRAKPDIWKDNAAFVKLQGDMTSAARALDAAAASGNVAGLTAARNSLGATCKSCHDRFRAEL
jgi:cytochrome c556